MTTATSAVPESTATTATTLCEAFSRTVEQFPDRVALRTAGGAEEITWREYAQRVRSLAAGLAGLGIGRGATVALMMTNRPEAFIADTAVLHVGATPFSIYTSSSPAQITYLLGHADTRVVIADSAFAQKILDVKPSLPTLEHVFVVDDPVEGAENLADVAAAARPDFDFEATWRAVTPDDVAVLIYTSGTTGAPKAVETTHANIIASRRMWQAAIPELGRAGRYMSYLPMAHMADRQVAHYPSLVTGSTVTTFTDAKTAMASLKEVRPTLSATVPRMWEKLKAALDGQFAQNPQVRAAVDAAMTKTRLELAGEPVPDDLEAACRQADEAIFSKVREQLGYDDVDALMSGAAPIGEDVLVFFAALGLPIIEVWGMSETATCGTANPKDGIRIGTVGKPLPEMEIVLAEDGELLLRGPSVMRGYRNDPDKTAEALDSEGFLHTGDIGQIDEDGYIRIVDRKKELIINAGGKNMSPTNIENRIKGATNLIANIVAIGDRRPYNTALIVLDPDEAAAFARANGIADTSAAALAADETVRKHVDAAVQEGNSKLSRIEQIKKFTILPEFWEPDSEVLTATMKLKRKPISERYAAEIDAMYVR